MVAVVLFYLCCVLDLTLLAVMVQSGTITSPTETFQLENTLFTIHAQTVNWLEAFTICRASRARLAVVHSKARADFLAKSISEAQIHLKDLWIGGKFVNDYWVWAATGRQLPLQKSSEGYPPWINGPIKRGRNCLALERNGYDLPHFVDCPCELQKSFVCETSVVDAIDTYPQMGISMVFRNSSYIAYHARVTWEQALAFCRQTEGILASVSDMKTAYFLVGMMRRSRPELEALWIGAQYLFKKWTWVSTNTAVPNVSSLADGYPPWRGSFSSHTPGKDCLMLDHHACTHDSFGHRLGVHALHDLCEEPAFLDSDCGRRKAFICEKPKTLPDEKFYFFYLNNTYVIGPENKTWQESFDACQEQNMNLAILDTKAKLNFVVAMTTEHSESINHLWLGAKLNVEKDMWLWSDNSTLPGGTRDKGTPTGILEEFDDQYNDITTKDTTTTASEGIEEYPPWCPRKPSDNNQDDNCLNLDRGDGNEGMFYSLDCDSKQNYVCQGPVKGLNGSSNSTSIYILQSKSATFTVAMEICKRKNMSLAVVNNMHEVVKIGPVIPEVQDVWVGARRKDGRWVWTKTGEVIPDRTGADGYPPWETMDTQVGRRCLAMRVSEDSSRVFVEHSCNNELWFICQQ